jgi:hypothetical protein
VHPFKINPARIVSCKALWGMSEPEVAALVAEEIESIADPERRRALIASLVRPERRQFGWQYGRERFECWVVAHAPNQPLQIVHSTPPPIASYPWCIVPCDDRLLGMDCCWFASLDDAFINGWWDGPLPEDYEIA